MTSQNLYQIWGHEHEAFYKEKAAKQLQKLTMQALTAEPLVKAVAVQNMKSNARYLDCCFKSCKEWMLQT